MSVGTGSFWFPIQLEHAKAFPLDAPWGPTASNALWISLTVWSWTIWCRKVREVCRIHFHLVAPLKTSVVTSSDQKSKKVNDWKSTDYFNISVGFFWGYLLSNVFFSACSWDYWDMDMEFYSSTGTGNWTWMCRVVPKMFTAIEITTIHFWA